MGHRLILFMRQADGYRAASQLIIPGFGRTVQNHDWGPGCCLDDFEIGPADPQRSDAGAEGFGDGFLAGKTSGQGGKTE